MPPLASRMRAYCVCSVCYAVGGAVSIRGWGAQKGGILNVALLGRAGMPLGVRKVRAAEPLPAALAILLSAVVAGFIHARNSLTGLFLGFDGWRRHRFLLGTCCLGRLVSGRVRQRPLCSLRCKQYTPVRQLLQPYCERFRLQRGYLFAPWLPSWDRSGPSCSASRRTRCTRPCRQA